jgi:hypothetical protein
MGSGLAPLALPSAPSQLVAITPCRIIDTRPGNPAAYAPGVPLQGGVYVTFDLNSAPAPCNSIPSTAVAYSLNVTAVGPSAVGFLSVFPGTTVPSPLTSLLNYVAGDVVANASAVPGDANGLVSFLSSATTHIVVDVNGYYAPGPTSPCDAGANLYLGSTNSVNFPGNAITYSSLIAPVAPAASLYNGAANTYCVGVLTDFQVILNGSVGPSNASYAFTLMWNGFPTGISCTVTAGQNTCQAAGPLLLGTGLVNVRVSPSGVPTPYDNGGFWISTYTIPSGKPIQ